MRCEADLSYIVMECVEAGHRALLRHRSAAGEQVVEIVFKCSLALAFARATA